VVANEVLDNVPFHRLVGTPDGVAELFVGLDEDRFVAVPGPPSSPGLVELAGVPKPGQERVASPAALDLVDRAAALLDPGYLLLLDYAATSDSVVHGYRGHRVLGDVLDAPGTRDITAGVDLDALARHARDRGWSVWGPVSQGELLEALGVRRLEEEALRAQQAALDERRGLDAVRIYSERNRLRLLTDPAGLGGLYAVCLGVGIDRGPRWATGGGATG
jgi:SAM-dependent MidA family methyltransferase